LGRPTRSLLVAAVERPSNTRGEDLAGRRMHGRCAVSGRPGTCTGLPAQVSDGVIVSEKFGECFAVAGYR
jgi:hypothetical protein